MEPKLPSPDRAFESHVPASVTNGEAASQSFSPETQPEQSAERREQQGEGIHLSSSGSDNPATDLALPVTPVTSDDPVVTLPQVKDDSPKTANDTVLIEKEWVEKAKKVIAETKDDPYRREQEVNKLQADYLFKRYGRKLGSPQ